MISIWTCQLGAREFGDSPTACQGRQVALTIRTVAKALPDLVWYASDVLAPGAPFWTRFQGSTPTQVGLSDEAAREAEEVPQFESGVFVGVPDRVIDPQFRIGGVWTEDGDDADLGDGVVEIRAFDTDYILVAASSPKVREHFASGLGD